MNAPLSEADRLRARIAELEDELAEWRLQFGEELGARSELKHQAEPDVMQRYGAPVYFTSGEWRALSRMLNSPGVCISKESLRLACLLPGSEAEGFKFAEVYICKIRRKLRSARAPAGITTLWGQGYVIGPADAATLRAWLGLPA